MTNVLRHAGARRLSLLVEHRDSGVVAVIEDDGRGFEPAAALDGKRLGGRGIFERAALIGGRLTIESEPGAGTTLTWRRPLRRPWLAPRDARGTLTPSSP